MKRRSIQFILTVAFSLFSVFIITTISLTLYSQFSSNTKENASRNAQQIIDQVSYNLADYIESTMDLYHMLHHTISSSEEGMQSDELWKLQSMISSRSDVVSLTLVDLYGKPIALLPNVSLKESLIVKDESWFKTAVEKDGYLSISVPHVQNLYSQKYEWVVSLSKTITFMKNGQLEQGVLLLDVNFKRIQELSERVSLGKSGYAYIIEESGGNIVYHPQIEIIYADLKQENVELALKQTYGSFIDQSGPRAKMISIQSISNVGWKVVGISYMDELALTNADLSIALIKILIALAIILLLVSNLISRQISKPIKKLEVTMRGIERGEFNVAAKSDGPLEIKNLGDRYNIMLGTIRTLMNKIVSEQESKRKYELDALQAQINPHFLYNTLNTVVRMISSKRNEDAVTMITALSKLFRISLSKGESLILISEEVEHVRNYLIIQQMRFKNKFDFQFRIDERALGYISLKLILQPLVENALEYGIEPSVDKGQIEVVVSLNDKDQIEIIVRDNGVGISEHQLKEINAGTYHSSSGSGVGLKNVNERIKLYFGEQYGLLVESELEEGTTVYITFPALILSSTVKEEDPYAQS
ncbi:MAG: sensor histidine kinase [Candidatus Pristimantibacillus lignocellulolyticus]|uniref:histidine kinase n=1 Tax=Candidatus Pristimantibacillus lignocellulolyticus TaxID=2994561 RepID=A0A9J6ZKQ5_9BACL|nr:MAG: sensor histidine kinase [Candidatus Pristimantibacillus lignocellulolyticus]